MNPKTKQLLTEAVQKLNAIFGLEEAAPYDDRVGRRVGRAIESIELALGEIKEMERE